jgi:D-alanyl-D-alanine endopeptidase (penicillin-binding protein 7)
MKALIAALLCLPLYAHAGCTTWVTNPCIAKPALTAKAYVVMDMDGNVVKAENADEIRSIASITKLITVSRSSQLAADEPIQIQPEDMKLGHMRTTPLKVGESYTRAQLTELALISSDNVAAKALGRSAPLTELASSTTIVEASGLDPANKSTARQIAELARSLYNTQLAATSVQPHTSFGNRNSTNPLLAKPGWTFYLSKTGFINESGGCLVVITQVGQRLLTIAILGSRDTHQRWRDLAELRKRLGDSDFYDPTFTPKRAKNKKRKHK